jgi:flagellar protein FlaG
MQVQATGNNPVLATQTGTATRSPDQGARTANASSAAARSDETSSEKIKQDNQGTVQDATKRLQAFVSEVRSDIQFSVDDQSGETVVKVIDRGTKEVIRQIPSEEALEIAKALDRLQGILVKQQA